MNILASAFNEAITGKRDITVQHRTRGRIVIRPLKVDNDTLLADIVKVDRLGDSPANNVRLELKDITLPRI